MNLKDNVVNDENVILEQEVKEQEVAAVPYEEVDKEAQEADEEEIDEEEDDDETKMYEKQIQDWKSAHGKIYLSVFDEVELIWHKLNRKVYNEIMNAINDNDEGMTEEMLIERRQLLVIQRCTVHPALSELNEIIDEYPGILTSLSAEILKRSGFSKPLTIEV